VTFPVKGLSSGRWFVTQTSLTPARVLHAGFKIHPGHGFLYVRQDSKSFNFITYKCAGYHLRKRNPRMIPWTQGEGPPKDLLAVLDRSHASVQSIASSTTRMPRPMMRRRRSADEQSGSSAPLWVLHWRPFVRSV
jgi:ribosomal protein L24E